MSQAAMRTQPVTQADGSILQRLRSLSQSISYHAHGIECPIFNEGVKLQVGTPISGRKGIPVEFLLVREYNKWDSSSSVEIHRGNRTSSSTIPIREWMNRDKAIVRIRSLDHGLRYGEKAGI